MFLCSVELEFQILSDTDNVAICMRIQYYMSKVCKKYTAHLYSFNLQLHCYGTVNMDMIWWQILNILIYSDPPPPKLLQEQDVKILNHVRYFLCDSREWGCWLNPHIKCHAVLGKGSLLRTRLSWSNGKVGHDVIISAVFWTCIQSLGATQVNPKLQLKAFSCPPLLINTVVHCMKL